MSINTFKGMCFRKVNIMPSEIINKRTEKREIIKKYYSVEIAVDASGHIGQFVIYDMSSSGLCLLVSEDSGLLQKIRVGEKYRMKYYPVDLLEKTRFINTRICHITKSTNNTLSGHYMVGLSLENGDSVSM